MSHDITADTLNMLMNAKRARKEEISTGRYSNFLIKVLDTAKKEGYLDYNLDKKKKILTIKAVNISMCRAIKPRFTVTLEEIDKYRRRYLPARNFGMLIISTSSGLMTEKEAYEKKIGGSLIAYFYWCAGCRRNN